jgi:hypothetical protein
MDALHLLSALGFACSTLAWIGASARAARETARADRMAIEADRWRDFAAIQREQLHPRKARKSASVIPFPQPLSGGTHPVPPKGAA